MQGSPQSNLNVQSAGVCFVGTAKPPSLIILTYVTSVERVHDLGPSYQNVVPYRDVVFAPEENFASALNLETITT
ncbi:hypothetical protein V499_08595 [Pseudogymnoascus sp. VKM F-103]|nr:hypothetical protein V499_08595 [Pseudogymnoascus sp. VKM F-103]